VRKAAVVTAHYLATDAAEHVLKQGGNAVEAAIAANAVLGVVAPETCGVGGDLFAIIHVPGESEPHALNSSGWAGSNVDAGKLRETHGEVPFFGKDAVTVPGCVAGWDELQRRYGNRPLSKLLEPAIAHAFNGFEVSVELAEALTNRGGDIDGLAIAAELLPNGEAPRHGTTLARPSLGKTLTAIAKNGPDAFYKGQPALDICEAVDQRIVPADLAEFVPEWVTPLRAELFGHTGWTIPPNSQGYLTLATLAILEELDRPEDLVDRWHLEIEAYRAVAWERNDVVGEPQIQPKEAAWYLDRERLKRRAQEIDLGSVRVWPPHEEPPGGTTALSVWDADGMGVVLIQSNFYGFGTTIGAGTSGFLLQNRGGSFVLEEGHPNQLRPRHRPLHTLSPSLWTRDGELSMLLTTRGGHQQPQVLAQIAAGLLMDGREGADMQDTYRWTTDTFEAGMGSKVIVEARTPQFLIDGLKAKGHEVTLARDYEPGWGPVALITAGPLAQRDPRVATSKAAHV
jgi:gamma-glutamyltranspeptidase/glutathione hydrolase